MNKVPVSMLYLDLFKQNVAFKVYGSATFANYCHIRGGS